MRERLVDRLRVLLHAAVSLQRDRGREPGLLAGAGATTTCLSDSSAARSAAIITLALLGSTTTSSAGTSWIAASSS